MHETVIYPKPETNQLIQQLGGSPLHKPAKMSEFLRRPEVTFDTLRSLGLEFEDNNDVLDAVEIDVKYSGYIKKQNEIIEQTKKFEQARIPGELDYALIKGLSSEEIDKLMRIRPRTLGQAQRISGVNPSALQAIMIYLKGTKQISI